MKRLVILATLLAFASPALAQNTHSVRGYVRSDGTYVQPHQQTNPNTTKLDNWTTQGNVNPTTGQPGTVNPTARQHRTLMDRQTISLAAVEAAIVPHFHKGLKKCSCPESPR
jgi:hypothetical protein